MYTHRTVEKSASVGLTGQHAVCAQRASNDAARRRVYKEAHKGAQRVTATLFDNLTPDRSARRLASPSRRARLCARYARAHTGGQAARATQYAPTREARRFNNKRRQPVEPCLLRVKTPPMEKPMQHTLLMRGDNPAKRSRT
jgi:phosphohistidine phosphatase SixA